MKIDLAINLDPLKVTEWDLQIWVAVLLLSQAFFLGMWLIHEVRRHRSPVDRLMRDQHFGGV